MSALLDLMPLQWLTAVILMTLRVGAMLLATPVFSAADLPMRVRLVLVVGLSAALCAGLGLLPDAHDAQGQALRSLVDHPLQLFRCACTEITLGIVMSLAIHAAFAAFAIAGQMLDVQLGFGLSQVFNPASNTASPVLSVAFSRIGVVLFFLVDGHHALVRALAFSVERIPLGSGWSLAPTLGSMLASSLALFSLCIALAAPILFCILLSDMALGVLARNLPQVNMLVMGIPLKIMVGLAALSLWFSGIGGAMDRVYKGLYQALDASIAATPAVRAGTF